jgi:hypothetical protein
MKTLANQTGVMHMRQSMGLLPLFLIALAGFTWAAAPSAVQAAAFEKAELFFELNHTDGDLGIHALIDGGPYVQLEIEDPYERRILLITASGRLARQGLTELFLESAEPPFDELAPKAFFRRFPEGKYEIEARTLDGEEIEATVMLSHVLAAPVGNVTVNGVPAAANCDAVPLPSASEPVIIDWDPVTTSHPEIGKTGPVEIARYQLFVEKEDVGVNLAIDLPPTVTEFQVPASITALGGTFKFEIIARTATGNNTAIESCYTVRP